MRAVLVPSLVAILCAAGPLVAQGPVDTIRVGSVALSRLEEGVDTLDHEMLDSAGATAGPSTGRHSVKRVTRVQLGGETVLHFQIETGPPAQRSFYDYYLDPRTLATRRFEQHTPIDSVIVTAANGCMSGWVDLQNAPRRTIDCDRATDRFADTFEENVLPLLPLKAGTTMALATYGAFGGAGAYVFTVTGPESLQIGGRSFDTWRLDRTLKTDYGTLKTTLWIDRRKPRIVQRLMTFPNGRVVTTVSRHP